MKEKFDWSFLDEEPKSFIPSAKPNEKAFDWSFLNENPNESKGLSGVASDALSAALQAPIGWAQGLMQLPSEAYGAGKQLLTDQPRFAENIAAGFGKFGHGLLSAPGNVRDYLAKKELIPQETPSFRLPESILPKDFDYGEAVGIQGHRPGDELIQGVPAGLAMAAPTSKLFELAGEIPLTKGVGAKKLNAVKQQLQERGLNKLNVSKDILKDAKQYLPNDTASKKLLEKAKTGEYESLFALQSDLRKRGSALQRSLSGAERLHGKDAHILREKLLQAMKKDLSKQGHQDLSDLLSLGQKRYAQHMKYRPYAGALLAGLAGHSPVMKLINKYTP